MACGKHRYFRNCTLHFNCIMTPRPFMADFDPSIHFGLLQTLSDRYKRAFTATALGDLQPKEIRNIEGLSRFLLPSLFSDLQYVARDRAIITLIASRLSCDAIIIPHKQPPTSIQPNLEKLQTLMLKLQRTSKTTKGKALILLELWDDVVRLVIEKLLSHQVAPRRKPATGPSTTQSKARSPTPPPAPNTRRTSRNPTSLEDIMATPHDVMDTDSAENFLTSKLLCIEGQPFTLINLSSILFHITPMSSVTPAPVHAAIRAVAFLLRKHTACEIAEAAAKNLATSLTDALTNTLSNRIVDHTVAACQRSRSIGNSCKNRPTNRRHAGHITRQSRATTPLRKGWKNRTGSISIAADRLEETADALYATVTDCQNAVLTVAHAISISHIYTVVSVYHAGWLPRRRCYLQLMPADLEFDSTTPKPELESVQSLLPPPPFFFLHQDNATKSRALRALQDYTGLHFSCHGTQKYEDPFNSAFLMRDQPLSLLIITQADLSRHEFAFLSACEAAVGDSGTPDEVIHLGAGVQFAGVKSVIGMSWKVNDDTVQRLVDAFYKNLCGDGKVNPKRAARALHRAVQSLACDKDMRA
ncbi:CHAT domain-containing protein [Suillus spraguei]|nr:CHAT domain-containing protein [Suillus spraguei]